MAYKSSARGPRPVSLVAGHTAEGARTARALANYFYRDDIQASSHTCIDAYEVLQIVPYDRAAWTLRSGNPISDNAEVCGFARWTRAQWLSTAMVDGCANPRQMLVNFARWARGRCIARGIPIRKLTIDQVRGGQAGIIHHIDWTEAMSDGTHWDMGPNVPWDFIMEVAMEEAVADSDMVRDMAFRMSALVQLNPTQGGGPGAGDVLEGVRHLGALVWRGDAILNNRLTVLDGPTKGEPNQLAMKLNTIENHLETVESKLDQVLGLLQGQQ